MQNLTEHIVSIEMKVKLVLQKMEELKTENNVLKKKNESLLRELEELIKKQETRQVVSPPIPNSNGNYEEIKKELDQYIEDIDQTIQLLKAS